MTKIKKASPLCSCIICKEIRPSKGIHNHCLAGHGTEDEKYRIAGKGATRNTSLSSASNKKRLQERKDIYNLSPAKCNNCTAILPYIKRLSKFCNQSCAGIKNNSLKDKKEIYSRVSASNKGKNTRPPYTRISQCKICKKWFPGKSGGFRINSTRKIRSIYKGYQMDSGAELAFAKLLNSHNIFWIKNTSTFFTYDTNRKYYPDFYLKEYNLWIEIKGKYYYNNILDPLKWAVVPNIEIIWSDNITLPLKLARIMGNDPT